MRTLYGFFLAIVPIIVFYTDTQLQLSYWSGITSKNLYSFYSYLEYDLYILNPVDLKNIEVALVSSGIKIGSLAYLFDKGQGQAIWGSGWLLYSLNLIIKVRRDPYAIKISRRLISHSFRDRNRDRNSDSDSDSDSDKPNTFLGAEGIALTTTELDQMFLTGIKKMKKAPKSIIHINSFHFKTNRAKFLRSVSNKSGIYMLKYKKNEKFFYIGRAIDLAIRLRSHYNRSAADKNRLGIFLTTVGWENISVHILEFTSPIQIKKKETYYIVNYLPTLNTLFSSIKSVDDFPTLSTHLKHRQALNRAADPRLYPWHPPRSAIGVKAFKLWAYVEKEGQWVVVNKFCNLQEAYTKLRITRITLANYVDTYVVYKGYLFFSSEIDDLNKNVLNKSNLLPISNYLKKKIWVYEILPGVEVKGGAYARNGEPSLFFHKIFNTIKEASEFIGTSRSTIVNILDNELAMSKGFYCFTYPITENLQKKLAAKAPRDEISSLSVKIWVYNDDLDLVNNRPFKSQQEMLRELSLKRARTVNKYKDSGISFKGFYFFSRELTSQEKEVVKSKNQYAAPTSNSKFVWVYKADTLINGKPFQSLSQAGKKLELDRKKIAKYLDTNEIYQGYKFFSKQLK